MRFYCIKHSCVISKGFLPPQSYPFRDPTFPLGLSVPLSPLSSLAPSLLSSPTCHHDDGLDVSNNEFARIPESFPVVSIYITCGERNARSVTEGSPRGDGRGALPLTALLGSLSNDDGYANENGKKSHRFRLEKLHL